MTPQASVFIVTYGRSGSTLLQNCLNALPGYLIRGENENLLAPLARAWDVMRHSEQQAKMHREGTGRLPSDPWFGYHDCDPAAFGAALAESFTRTVLRPEAETRVIGFKEIRWHNDPQLFPVMLDFLRAHFPRARILFNTRDHARVARSGWWKWMDPEQVARQLAQADRLYADYAARHPEDCLMLRYDDYVTGAEAWRPLFDFLQEPFAPDLVTRVLARKLTHLQS